MAVIYFISMIAFSTIVFLIIFSPTIIYIIVGASIFRRAKGRQRTIALFTLMLLAMVSWLWALVHWALAKHEFESRISAIPTLPVPINPPATIMTDDGSLNFASDSICFKKIFESPNFHHRAPLLIYPKNVKDEQLPDRYLVFRNGRNSKYWAHLPVLADNTPHELTLIDGNKEILLALDYPYPIRIPLPVLTTQGWWRKSKAFYYDRSIAHMLQFVAQTTGRCAFRPFMK